MKKRRTLMLRKERRWRKLFVVVYPLLESKTLDKMALSSNLLIKLARLKIKTKKKK